jgi:hypothetical protein
MVRGLPYMPGIKNSGFKVHIGKSICCSAYIDNDVHKNKIIRALDDWTIKGGEMESKR